jgi:acyl-CoA dehydrogenase
VRVHPFYAEFEPLIDSITKLVAVELSPKVTEWEKAGRFPNEVFTLLGKNGYLGLLIDEEYGGVGGDYKMAGAWCETFGELASVGLTVGVNMHSVVISHALQKYGTTEAKKKWLPKAVLGEALGAYAFTEPGAGSDLARARTTAVRKGDKWTINGSKTFITNGARAHFVLVLTKTDTTAGYKGFTTFVVDTTSPGFKVARTLDKVGWHASDTAELVFENVEVDDSCILGKVGDGWIQAATNLNWERLMLTLTSLAGARMCHEASQRYCDQREAFGKKIGEFDTLKAYLAEMNRKIVMGEALARHALTELNAGRECKLLVSAAKRLVCDDAVWIADRAIQIHGGYGYTTEFSPERWWRDLRLMPIGGGTSEIMSGIVVKELAKIAAKGSEKTPA